MNYDENINLLPLGAMAHRLNVPANWLRAEAESGRIPSLKAGKRTILFRPDIVEKLLIARAGGEGMEGGENAGE